MPQASVIDTYPSFLDFWSRARDQSLDTQIQLWVTSYMSHWPDLLEMQQRDYEEQGLDWREVARQRVFPFLPERLAGMTQAREALLACVEPVYQSAQQALGLDFDVLCVIYVGIGCGAGWATSFRGTPSCLFGLENAVECGWTRQEPLAGLTAHELSHLLHQQWRVRHHLAKGKGPFWQLYEEGFAQRGEHRVLGKDTWHQQESQENWLDWCAHNRAWLAAEFLRRVDGGEPVHPFFGSWFDIKGQRQCGYFLGHEMIRDMEDELSLEDIALLSLDAIEQKVRKWLEKVGGADL